MNAAAPGHNDKGVARRHLAPMILIIGCAFVLRLIYLYEARANPLFHAVIMDARSYWQWSERLVKGDWIGDTIFYQAPLYPYLLGVLKLLTGSNLWNIKLVQAGIGSAACGILYLAATRWFPNRGRAVPLLAGLLLATYPAAIFYDSLIQKTNIGLLWMTVLLWLLGVLWNRLRPNEEQSVSRVGVLLPASLGAVVGLMMLTREETLLLAPLPAACLLWNRAGGGRVAFVPARRLTGLAAYIFGLAIILLPVALRNHHVGGEWVVTTSQAGPNLFIGNNPDATGLYAPLRPGRSNTIFERQDAFELAEQALGHKPTPTEVSGYWRGRAVDFAIKQPGRWLRLMSRKAMLLVNAYEVPDAEDLYHFQQNSLVLSSLIPVWHMGVLVPLAGLGLVFTARRWRELWPLHACILVPAAGVVIFYVMGRYRYTIVPPLMLFAAAGTIELLFVLFARRWGPLVAAASAAVPLAVISNWPLMDRQKEIAGSISNAGAALAEAGDDAGAIGFYQQALKINPNLPDTLANMGMSQARTGKKLEAAATFALALKQRPNDPRSLFRMGTALAEIGRNDEAISHLKEALLLSPQDVDTRTNLTSLLMMQHRHPELRDLLKDTLKRSPNDPRAAAELSWLLATSSDDAVRNGSEALAIIRPLQAADPLSPDLMDILAAALAATGDFTAAAAMQQQAVQRASDPKSGLPPEVAQSFTARLESYRQGKGYRE